MGPALDRGAEDMARFLLKMNAQAGNNLAMSAESVGRVGFSLTPLMPNSRGIADSLGLASAEEWFLAQTDGEMNPGDAWDECHARVSSAFGIAGAAVSYAEPDIIQPFVTEDRGLAVGFAAAGQSQPTEEYWMSESIIPHGDNFDWHLGPSYSGLRDAVTAVLDVTRDNPWKVRIGHLDTGYTDNHQLLPVRLDRSRQRSFVSGDSASSAVDPLSAGLLKNPGHGTGTIGLLAGSELKGMAFGDENKPGFYIGGAPLAMVVPVRIAPSVVLLSTSSFVQGLDYLLAPEGDRKFAVDVVSMSMGGVCSSAWTEVVNRAYEAGVVLCTAAGNHYGDLPPTSIVYPARYHRVIAVCGVMADGRPYADLPLKIMCGCYGPNSKMSTAMAAYSPNLPWALYDNRQAFRWDGQGTSAATPQVAAAAALYIEKNYDKLRALPGWQRVEAVRNALFTGARKRGEGIDPRLGNGTLNALAALKIAVDANARPKEPLDSGSFPFLHILTGLGLNQSVSHDMLNTEILQLTAQYPDLQKILPDPDATPVPSTPDQKKRVTEFLSAITNIPGASKNLKAALSVYLKTDAGSVGPALPWEPPTPPCRKLRGYVFDPSMTTELQYVNLSQTTYSIRWEAGLTKGEHGFCGEYLQIKDPLNQPVDFNDKRILAQDGLDPSETSPQFRHQMLYAVGMQTIDDFEAALGRLITWAQDEPQTGSNQPSGSTPKTASKTKKAKPPYRRQLILYPHGIEAPNAFYSPQDRAIYFGYFKAKGLTGNTYPGMVYAALSHDIIAHEMTHALLDGMHKAFREPSNPDVLAFHEAFADIVALLQQFGNLEVVRSQSAAVRGDLTMESLLGNLARQFGEATEGRSALRSAYLQFNKEGEARKLKADPNKLTATTEAHDRGAILVAAVYHAFLSIYRTRTVDLYRIASDGKSETALHLLSPDMVCRLATEASRAARHVLKMCIRALDYCPPVDITFGDFLRAVLTADFDLVPDDALHYRVAFIESFRQWRIYPEGLQTLNSETLIWPSLSLSRQSHNVLTPVFTILKNYAGKLSVVSDREELFDQIQSATAELTIAIRKIVQANSIAGVANDLDLSADIDFDITRLRFSHKTSPAGSLRPRVLISLTQVDGQDVSGVPIRWGSTLVIDLASEQILYRIPKLRAETDREARHTPPPGSHVVPKLALLEPFMLLHQS
jgi:Subtilase family